jgi:uroporphyrinogen-III synthase
MTLFITRPRADAMPLAVKLQAAGHDVVVAPVLDIVPRDGVEIPPGQYQAVCITSANGVRCLEGAVNPLWPALCVGPQSAEAARARGFRQVSMQGGNVQGLAAYVSTALQPQNGALLYLSGSETSGDLEGQLRQAGFEVVRLVTYDAKPQKLDLALRHLKAGDGALLYSPRSAKLWAAEIAKLDLQSVARDVTHYCLSEQVRLALPNDFPARVAFAPHEKAMLALLDLAGEGE